MDRNCGRGYLGHVGHLITWKEVECGMRSDVQGQGEQRVVRRVFGWDGGGEYKCHRWMLWCMTVFGWSWEVAVVVETTSIILEWPIDRGGMLIRSDYVELGVCTRRDRCTCTLSLLFLSTHDYQARVQVVGRRMRSLTLNPSEHQELPSLTLFMMNRFLQFLLYLQIKFDAKLYVDGHKLHLFDTNDPFEWNYCKQKWFQLNKADKHQTWTTLVLFS